jgi:hypothetical protein
VERSLCSIERRHVQPLAQEDITDNQLCHATVHRKPPYPLAIGAGMLTLHHPDSMRCFKCWVESCEGISFCQGLLKTFPSLPKLINPLFFGEQESFQRFMVTLSSPAYFTSDTIVYVSADYDVAE